MTYTRHCPGCLKEWSVPDHIVELYHQCPGGGPHRNGHRRRVATIPSREEHRSAFWHALLAEAGPDSIWRPLTTEEVDP